MIKKIILSIFALLTFTEASSFKEILGLKDNGWGYHYNIPRVSVPALVATGLIIGNDSRFGNTVWKSIDSMLMGGVITQAGKAVFGRVRPNSSSEYDQQWFQYGNESFPSGHVSSMSSIVSPFIYEYAEEQPLIHLLWLVPIHQMFGRVNDKAHYKTDVAAGFLVGALSGWWAHKRDIPLTLSWKEGGVYAGLEFDF